MTIRSLKMTSRTKSSEARVEQPVKGEGPHQVIISVGSNIEPHKNILLSQDVLNHETQLLAIADVIETTPVGYTHQPDFLNTAYLVETELEHDEFNAFLKTVEDRLGRKRGPIKSGPRTIDLDIVIWDGQVMSSDYFNYAYVSTPVDQILTGHRISVHR